jgi:hypothetical protein
MKKLKVTLTRAVFLILLLIVTAFHPLQPEKSTASSSSTVTPSATLYSKLHLSSLGLPQTVFNMALAGWQKLKAKGVVNKNVIAICDFTQSSTKKRLYIVDLDQHKLLFNTLVAHGKNTGEEFARSFSNEPSSYKSSLGFYTTKQTYEGEHGLSLRLEGLEKGFNDKAEERAIVLHGADYVCNNFVCEQGRLGRSWGCPAVSYEEHEAIINTLKDGSCLFIYYPDKKYLASSKLLQ